MDTLKKAKNKYSLSKTNTPLLPYAPVKINYFPDDKKKEIEQIIKNNAERREELIKNNVRPHLNLQHYKVNIDISHTPASDIDFDTHTDFLEATLPSDFSSELFMEKGKDSGQNIHELHQKGITGRGIKIAIIDEGLSDHEEYHNKIVHYEQFCDFPVGSYHGSGVTSLAVGTNCGMAPEANVYFFAGKSNSNPHFGERTVGDIPKAIKRCLEINELLPEGEKITAISISQTCDPTMTGYDEYEKMRQAAESAGINVITVMLYQEKGLSFDGYNRNLQKDINSTDSICSLDVEYADSRAKPEWFSPDKSKRLLFPIEHRTAASNTGFREYSHYAIGGYSWIIPQITGLYALCKQVTPDCTLEQMWNLGLETGFKRKGLNGIVVQPQKLIEQLQKEKILENKLSYQKTLKAKKDFSLIQSVPQKTI